MEEAKKNLLTYAGLRKLEDELHDLKVVKRKEVAGKIKEAREQGDLSENAEYDAAKDEQRDIEARIEELEAILKNAEVVVEAVHTICFASSGKNRWKKSRTHQMMPQCQMMQQSAPITSNT